MTRLRLVLGCAGVLVTAACVTINVYFPAAAAERAADRIIDEVWGKDGKPPPGTSSVAEPGAGVLAGVADWLVPVAAAQDANIDISTPAIQSLQASMRARHDRLAPFYEAGAVGLTEDGGVAVRDAGAVPVRERAQVNQLVAEENRDRDALYREIARANGHPEWEAAIRTTFARRWIERARPGWWYRDGGTWRRK